jgi:sigma-B regulation protein RsbU (phosphoserine phosphatase)
VKFFSPIFNNRFPVGTAEIETKSGHNMLVSFAEVGRAGLLATSVVEKAAAMRAIDRLTIESALFFLTILSILVLIGVLSSFRLTSALQNLMHATKQIAGGDYKIKLNIKTDDEVGELASSISTMATEIVKSIEKTAENVRLVNELETVRLIQEMMFPGEGATIGPMEVVGHFQPASECGGDWYHYSMMGDRVFLWIGDVTGHGAQAALITACAKAVSSIIEQMPDVGPAQALKILNHAIHSTSKGEVLMTFVILSIDVGTGLITYANASHESCFVLPEKDVLKKKDFIPLNESEGRRLGESADSVYQEAQHQLNPGDTLFLYTDGLLDLTAPSGEILGERNMIKIIGDHFGGRVRVREKLDRFKGEIAKYRGETPLKDDLTMLVAQYKPKA